MQTRDQKYAIDIFGRVSKVSKEKKEYQNIYGGMSHKLPILIHTAGLAQALSFVEAKAIKVNALQQLLKDLSATVEQQDLPAVARNTKELSAYIRLTQQVMAALLWYKRFAQSVLDVDVSNRDDTILDEGK
jgi:CRISPR-associated protein Cmr5